MSGPNTELGWNTRSRSPVEALVSETEQSEAGRAGKSWFDRTRGALGLVRRWFPLTTLGVFSTALGALAVYIGRDSQDLIALVIGYGALGLTGGAVLSVLFGVIWQARGFKAGDEPLNTRTEVATTTGASLPAMRAVPFLRASATMRTPERVELEERRAKGRVFESAVFGRRGATRELEREISVGDVLGLARVTFRTKSERLVRVAPHLGSLRVLPKARSMADGADLAHPSGAPDGDRLDLRRYAPGDPARFIHWKVFARNRKLVVRHPERAVERADRVLGFLVCADHDEAAAAAALLAVSKGSLGRDWAFATSHSASPVTRVDEARALITESGGQRSKPGALGAFVSRAAPSGPIALIVFAPPTCGDWIKEVAALNRKRRGVRVVIAVDGLRVDKEQSALSLVLRTREPSQGDDVSELDRALDALRRQHVEVAVVDRKSGRVLGDAHRKRVLAEVA